MRMKKLTVQDINNYVGTTVNPLNSPDTIYELYSVPSFDSDYPEVLHGSEIGSSKVTIEENDVLVCKINPRINRVWIVKHHTKHQLIASSEWVIIRSPENNPRYLMYYFQSPTFRTYINSGLTGIGGSLTRAQPKQIAKYPVPLPSIELQDRIAATLDKLQSIITHRKQQLKKLDELVKARFVEMFGDTEINGNNFPIRKLCEVCTVSSSKRIYQEEQSSSGVPFLRISNLVELIDNDRFGSELFIPEEKYNQLLSNGLVPKTNDILVTSRGTLGKCYIIQDNDKFYFQDGMISWLYNLDNSITALYLTKLFDTRHIKKQIDNLQSGSTVAYLSIAMLKKLNIVVPPLELQEQFAAFVAQTDKSKVVIETILSIIRRVKIYDQF